MGGLTGALAGERAGTHAPTPNLPSTRVMRILRPQSAPSPRPRAPAVPRAAGAGGARLRCRVRLADGRVFTGALPAARHRALQLGMLHAATAELVELTPGTRTADGELRLDRRARPEHFLPGGAAGDPGWLAALLAHAQQICDGAYAHRRAGEGGREEAFVGVAPRRAPARQQGRGRRDTVPVGRHRPARPAARAVGVPGRAALPPADRIRRLRRRARLLEARRTAPGDADRRGHRRARGADRAGAPADHPRPRSRRRRQAERRRRPVQGARTRDAARRHDQPQDRTARADRRGRLPAARLPARSARRRSPRPRAAGSARARRASRRSRRPVQADPAAGVLPSGSPASPCHAAAWSAAPSLATTTRTRRAASAWTRRKAGAAMPAAAARAAPSTTSPPS